MAAPRSDRSLSRVPGRASNGRTQGARDALVQPIADPRGSPGEGDASAEAPAQLGARRRRQKLENYRRLEPRSVISAALYAGIGAR